MTTQVALPQTPPAVQILRRIGHRLSKLEARILRKQELYRLCTTAEHAGDTDVIKAEIEQLREEISTWRDLLAEVVGWLVPITAIDEAKLVRVAKDRSSIDPPEYLEVFERLRQLDTIGHTGKLWEALVANEYEAMVAVKLLSAAKAPAAKSRAKHRDPRPKAEKLLLLQQLLRVRRPTKWKLREIAKKGGFSDGWVGGEKLWLDYEAKHKKVAIKAAAVSLTPALQGSIGNDDEDLERLKQEDELAAAMAEQRSDYEPSPLDKRPSRGPRIRKVI